MKELLQRAKELGLHLLDVLLDLVYLCLWLFLNWKVDVWIEGVHLNRIGKIEENCFVIIFAIASVMPVLFYIGRDLVIMAMRTKHALDVQRRLLKDSWESRADMKGGA